MVFYIDYDTQTDLHSGDGRVLWISVFDFLNVPYRLNFRTSTWNVGGLNIPGNLSGGLSAFHVPGRWRDARVSRRMARESNLIHIVTGRGWALKCMKIKISIFRGTFQRSTQGDDVRHGSPGAWPGNLTSSTLSLGEPGLWNDIYDIKNINENQNSRGAFKRSTPGCCVWNATTILGKVFIISKLLNYKNKNKPPMHHCIQQVR